jgi:4-hydroxybenzoate polyprenyltransferase
MMINRIIDISIDRLNPRTKERHLAAGRITLFKALVFSLISAVLYLFSAYLLGPVPFKLAWVPLLFFVVYPYTKRFTWLCHVFLGVTLGLAPLAGWIAVNPAFEAVPFLLLLCVLFWVAGFDIFYASLDYEFDRESGVKSIPARFGLNTSSFIAIFSHIFSCIFLFLTGFIYGLSTLWFAFAFLACIFLILNDLKYIRKLGTPEINVYLQKNSYFSVIVFLGTLIEVITKKAGILQ